jgi:NAD+-dependent protein deacetylase sirtuin 5
MARSSDVKQFHSVLRQSKNVIAIAGAGLSAASGPSSLLSLTSINLATGIPTFRGAGGFWRSFDFMKLATPEAFSRNPSRVWQFYHYRREK